MTATERAPEGDAPDVRLDPDLSLAELAAAFAEIKLRVAGDEDALPAKLVEVAVDAVPGAEFASVTVRGRQGFRTAASTSERADAADAIQYELRSGPCVDAAADDTVYNPADLRRDPRWPEFGRRVDALGIRSMLAFRLAGDGAELGGALNLFATVPDAFGPRSRAVGLLLATHATAVLALDRETKRSEHLEQALERARDIGVGIGVLMALHKITREAAFDLLRIASQNTHRKVRDLAIEVAETGTLPTGRSAPKA